MHSSSFPSELSQYPAVNGFTLLMDSIAKDDEPVIRNLIEMNANLDASDQNGTTPLMWGAIKGKQKGIELLIKGGAKINAQNLKGQRALHFAAFEGRLEVVKQLVFAKADVNHPCHEGCSAFNYALKNSHYAIADELIREGSNIDVQDKIGFNQLLKASAGGNAKQVQFLLEYKAKLELVDKTAGLTALTWSATYGHFQCTKLLLEAKANVDARNDYGACSLGNAMISGNSDIVKLLVEAHAVLDIQCDNGKRIPLIEATVSDHLNVVRTVIEAKANLEVKDSDQERTPLIAASLHNKLKIVELLLHHKADPEARTKQGATALLLAANHGYDEVVQKLHCAGASINVLQNTQTSPLIATLGSDDFNTGSHKKVAEYLLDNGADVNIQNQDGYTALIFAAKWGDISLIERLIDKGAQMDLKEKFMGGTALHAAMFYNHKDAFELLLKRGANPHIPNNDRNSACDYAFFENREDIIHLLLKYGWLSQVGQSFRINEKAIPQNVQSAIARRKKRKGQRRKQEVKARPQLVERIKIHRAQVLKEQQQKEEERLQRITEEQERQRKRLIDRVNMGYASPVEFSKSEDIWMSTTAECKDLALKKLTEEEKKKAAKLNKKPAPISKEKEEELEEQKTRELEKNQELESIQRQFFLKPAVYAIYQRLFKKGGAIKLAEILQLFKALQGIEIPNESQEGEEIRLLDVSEKTHGSHVNIKLSRNPRLSTGSEPAVSARFVFLRNCENLKEYSIDQACKKLTDLGFGLDNIREEGPENVLA